MASAVIGAAVIRVLPQTTGFAGKVRREMQSAAQGASRPFRDLGFNIKRQLTSAFSAGLASLNNLKAGAQSLSRFFARNFTIPIGIALGAITKLTTEFESGMLRVEALTTRVGDSVSEVARRMEALSATARELGRTTEFTANQASEAMQNFALAGFNANEIMVATESTLSLASAGQVDLAQAADITTTAIRGFNLEADDAGRVADVMAQTFTNSNTDLEQLGQAFKFVAPVAAAAGLTFEETSAALGILSNAGLKASIAGTSLRGIITKLINPSEKAKGIIQELGIEVFDADGNMRSLVDIVGQFEGSMRNFGLEVRDSNGDVRDLNDILNEVAGSGGNAAGVFETITGLDTDEFLTENAQAFADIGVSVFDTNGVLKSFNKVISDSNENAVTASQAMGIFAQRAGPGMLALISQGSAALENLTNANLNAAGRAAEIQAKQMEGLRGSFLLLKSAAEGLSIEIGLTFAESLGQSARAVADFVNQITDWVEANQALTGQIVKFASALAALGPGFFFVSKAIGLIASALTTLFSPLRLFLAALVGAGVFFQRMIQQSDALASAVQDTFQIFKAFAGPILTLFGSILGATVNDVDSLAEAVGDRLAGVLENFNKGVKALTDNGAIQNAVQFLSELFVKVREFISTTGADAARGVFDFLVDAGEDVVSVFEALLPLFQGFVDFLTGDFVRGVAGFAVEALGTFFDALGAIADFISPLTNLIGRNFTPILVTLGSLFVTLKIRALEFGTSVAVAGASVKSNLTAPLAGATTALLSGAAGMERISVKAGTAAGEMTIFARAAQATAGATGIAAKGLFTAATGMDRLSQSLKKAEVGRKALVGLTTAIAGFSLGKMIQEADDLQGRLVGLGSAISNIAIAFAIGGPWVAAITAVGTVIGQVTAKMSDAEGQTFALIDATDELRAAFSDFELTTREVLESFTRVFNEIHETGANDMRVMLNQIGKLDVAGSNFGSTLSDLAMAAAESNDAFEDVFDNILTNALKIRVQAARDLGEFTKIFEDFIDRSQFTEDPFGLGNLSVGALFKSPTDRFDEDAFEGAKLRASELFEQLLLMDDGAISLSISFKEVEDGAGEVGSSLLNLKANSGPAIQALEELNELGVDFAEIPLEDLFGSQAVADGLVNLQKFGIEIDGARVAAELARPAMEEARRQEELLLEVTKPLAASFDDVARAIGDATFELGLLTKTDPLDVDRRLLDTLGAVEGFGRFKIEGEVPDFAELFSVPEGDDFRNFIDSFGSDLNQTLIAMAVDAEGNAETLAASRANLIAQLREQLKEQVGEDAVDPILALLEDETLLQFTPEFLIDSQAVADAREQVNEALKKQDEERAAALGLEPGDVFIPTPEFSPEFKDKLREDAALAFSEGFSQIDVTKVTVSVDEVEDTGFLQSLSPLGFTIEDGQIEVPAVTIPTSISDSDLLRDVSDPNFALAIRTAALRGEESITIPLTPEIQSVLEGLDREAVLEELTSNAEQDGEAWAEAFTRGIVTFEPTEAIQEMFSGITDPAERQKLIDIMNAGGLAGVGDLNAPAAFGGPTQSELDEFSNRWAEAEGAADQAATGIETSTQRIVDSITDMVGSMAGTPQVFEAITRVALASISTQVSAFRIGFWNPFRRTVNGAADELGLSLDLPAFVFHSGGIVGAPTNRVAETGGLASDEVFALLQKGEGVLPRDVMSKMTPAQFEALRRGQISPDDTFDPTDEIGDAYTTGVAAALGHSSQVGDSVNSVSSSTIDAVMSSLTASINAIFARSAITNIGAAIMAQAARETTTAAVDFLRGANETIDQIFLNKFGSVSAWPVGTIFRGGPAQDDLSQEVDFLRRMKGQINSFPAILTYLRATGTPFRVTSTLRNTLVRGTNKPSLHNVGRAVDVAGLTSGTDSPELLAIYNALGPVAGLVRRIYSGPGGGGFGKVGSVTWQDHHDHVHLALANGAVIRERVLAELGEAGDEVVIPLDRPERAMALALQSGLFDTLARSTQASPASAAIAPTRSAPASSSFDGGPLGGGPGNTYHIQGVTLDQVKAEIRARDEATTRVRR